MDENQKSVLVGQMIIAGSFVSGLAISAAFGAGQNSILFAVLAAGAAFLLLVNNIKKNRIAAASSTNKKE